MARPPQSRLAGHRLEPARTLVERFTNQRAAAKVAFVDPDSELDNGGSVSATTGQQK
jgi:hypothetical protein